jgi:replication factor C subunit 3/5
VYHTSGAPLPADVETVLDLLMNHTFQNACEQIMKMCTEKGYALVDILQDLTLKLTAMNLNGAALAALLDGMSDVEHRLAFGTDDKLQTASLVGVFVKARQSLELMA